MIVVADSSPFIALINIQAVDILPKLYESVIIPSAVAVELSDAGRPLAVQQFMASRPSWLSIRSPLVVQQFPDLHLGESHAISLAGEIRADFLLIDDRTGRDAAIALGITTVRTTALMLAAAKAGYLNLDEAFTKLKATNFRVSAKVLEDLLATFRAFKSARGGQE